MDEEEIQEKLIGLAETIFILLLIGVEEAIEALILVITLGAGIIITEVMNGAVALAIEMYLLLRGGKGVMKLVVQPICATIDAATGGLAPGKLVGTAAGIWVINNPEKMEKVTGIISKAAGSAVQIAATAVGGVAGGAVARVAGGKVVGAVAEKATEKAVEVGATAARSRLAMVSRAASARVAGSERMAAQGQQTMEQAPMEEPA